MNHPLSIALLLFTLAPQHQKLPDAFYQIPEQVRERATVIVSGKYAEGISPCIFMPDGSRERALESWFNIKRVYRGKVSNKAIFINRAMLPVNGYSNKKLKRDHNYLVLLRPSEESMKMIQTREDLSFWDALHDEEIIAIVDLK
jgi:hypothetical protein